MCYCENSLIIKGLLSFIIPKNVATGPLNCIAAVSL